MDHSHSYIGFELAGSPFEPPFRQACLRAPDVVYAIRKKGGRKDRSYLVFWRSYESGFSERGYDEMGRDVGGTACILPLGVVFLALAEGGALDCRRALFLTAADGTGVVPPLDWHFLYHAHPVNSLKIQLEVLTPHQFAAAYAELRLLPREPWVVEDALREAAALRLFERDNALLESIHDDASYDALMPLHVELLRYGGLLLGLFRASGDGVALACGRGRQLCRAMRYSPWFAGSAVQRRLYPTGLMLDWDEAGGRHYLYDFAPGRRFVLRRRAGRCYLYEWTGQGRALPYDAGTRRHLLPDAPISWVIDAATGEWMNSCPR